MSQSTAVTADHLRRLACLYVRQSSLQQVQDHQESTARQYALKRRALALGWAAERIVVIDEDLGLSGASAAERTGFQRIVADVGLGRVGMVMGLEVSRLARNSSDWHRLLEICALSETLISMKTGSTTRPTSTTACCSDSKAPSAKRNCMCACAPRGTTEQGAPRRAVDLGMVFTPAQARSGAFVFDTFDRTGSAGAVVRYFQQSRSRGRGGSPRPRPGARASWRSTVCSPSCTIRATPERTYGRTRQRAPSRRAGPESTSNGYITACCSDSRHRRSATSCLAVTRGRSIAVSAGR